jgi:predicted DNA-binding ribbon-helix-helix protein
MAVGKGSSENLLSVVRVYVYNGAKKKSTYVRIFVSTISLFLRTVQTKVLHILVPKYSTYTQL